MAGKNGEGEITSKAENKCQLETELEKSTSGMQNTENTHALKAPTEITPSFCVVFNYITSKSMMNHCTFNYVRKNTLWVIEAE